MMIPNDYDSAKAYTGGGSFATLPVGGHVCRIIDAREATSRQGNPMLEVAIDIAEGGPDDGFYKDMFESKRASKPDAKWPCIFRTGLLNKEGKTSGFFKGLITAIEDSNAGYNFKATGGDEKTLKGKMVGFNFGEEEWRKSDGSIGVSVKPFWAVSVEKVREGIDPPERKKLKENAASSKAFKEVEDVDLPF